MDISTRHLESTFGARPKRGSATPSESSAANEPVDTQVGEEQARAAIGARRANIRRKTRAVILPKFSGSLENYRPPPAHKNESPPVNPLASNQLASNQLASSQLGSSQLASSQPVSSQLASEYVSEVFTSNRTSEHQESNQPTSTLASSMAQRSATSGVGTSDVGTSPTPSGYNTSRHSSEEERSSVGDPFSDIPAIKTNLHSDAEGHHETKAVYRPAPLSRVAPPPNLKPSTRSFGRVATSNSPSKQFATGQTGSAAAESESSPSSETSSSEMHEDTESESVVSARAKKKKGLMKKLKFKIPFTKSSLSKKNSVLTMGSGSLPASPHSSVASPHTPVSANPKSSFPSSPQQPDASSFPTGSIASRAAAFGQPIKTSNLPNNKDLTGKEPQGRNATEGRNKAETHTSKGIQGHLKGILSSNKTHGHLKEDTGRSTDGHSKGETTKSKQEPATRISSHEPDESDETLVGYAPSVTQSIAKKHVDMVVQYEEELRELKSQLAPLERHNMEGDAQIEQLKALINEKEEYSARVHTDFLEAQRDLLRLQDENTQLQSALKQQELLLASFKPAEGLEAQLNEARSELEQLRLRPPHRHDLSECPDCYQLSENQRVAAARELEQQKELVQQKKQDYDALQSQVQNLRRECSQKQSQITRMAHDLDSLMSIQAEAKAPPVAKFSRGAQTEPTSKGTPKGSSPRGSGSRKGRILAELNDSYRKNPLTDELRLCLEHQETMKATKEAALQIAAAAQKLQALTGSKSPLPPDAAAYTTVGPKGPSNSNSPRGSTSADPVIATVPNAPAASPAAVSPAAVVTGRPVGSGHTHMAVEAQLFLPDSSLFEPTSHDRQWHYGSSSMLVNHTATQRGWSYRWANGRYVLERLVQ